MGLRFLSWPAVVLGWMFFTGLGLAQSGEKLRVLSGTTFHTPQGQRAFLMWQSQDLAVLRQGAYAVYGKVGAPASPATFQPIGVFKLQTQPAILKAILAGAPVAIHDGPGLQSAVDGLFGKLLPASNLPFENRLSAVLQIAEFDLDAYSKLVMLARSHPMLGVCLGTAAVVPMSLGGSISTFEVRMQPAQRSDVGADYNQVVGRVTLNHAAVVTIPASPAPVAIPDLSPKGNLNARLRWATTEDQRRMTALMHGFNLFRVPRAHGESLGWHLGPPDGDVLDIAVLTDPLVVRVNDLPILPATAFTPLEAANLAFKPEEFHFLDNNNALGPGATGPRFTDGQQFYYFVAPRDLIGRTGKVSPATLVTMHATLPPSVPVDLRVENSYKYNPVNQGTTQELKVSWAPPRDGSAVSGYIVYRWENVQEMLNSATPATYDDNAIGVVAHVPGVKRYSLQDDGNLQPKVPQDLGKSFWYTVRAQVARSGGTFLSGNSAPAYGVLRDRKGPPKGAGRLTYRNYKPTITLTSSSTGALPADTTNFKGPGGDVGHFRMNATRLVDVITEVQFYQVFYQAPGQPPQLRHVGGGPFKPGVPSLTSRIRILVEDLQNKDMSLLVVGTDLLGQHAYGIISNAQISALNLGTFDLATFNFNLNAVVQTRTIEGGVPSANDPVHDSVVPDGAGAVNPIGIEFLPTATAKEFKLYKRIDDGPLLLVRQGTESSFDFNDVELLDYDMPAHAARLCYFLQYFDEHGNPSALMQLGCVDAGSRVPLPQPMVSPIVNTDGGGGPRARVSWFCPPEGVERFRVYVAQELLTGGGGGLREVRWQVPVAPVVPGGPLTFLDIMAPAYFIDGKVYRAFETGRVGGDFGDPATPGQFKVEIDVTEGVEVSVIVEAISRTGRRGPPSPRKPFVWRPLPEPGPQVPWPARALPPIDEHFIPEVTAEWVGNGGFAGVRIGTVSVSPEVAADTGKEFFQAGGIKRHPVSGAFFREPTLFFNYPARHFGLNLFESDQAETMLPCVVYRYQTANATFPNVSGDVVQVTPLIDQFRHRVEEPGEVSERVAIYDPFIHAVQTDPATDRSLIGLFIRDSQGVVRGASYTYLVVRFKANGEIERVIKTNAIEIP